MHNRPKIKLQLSLTDLLLEGLGWSLLGVIWTVTLLYYSSLPEIIPIHFNGAGEADGFGNKSNLFALPIVSTLLFVGMTFLNKFPHIFNYPTEITADNAQNQYRNATKLIRVLKTIILIVFNIIVLHTIHQTSGDADFLGPWLLPIILGLIFIPLFYYIYRSIRLK